MKQLVLSAFALALLLSCSSKGNEQNSGAKPALGTVPDTQQAVSVTSNTVQPSNAAQDQNATLSEQEMIVGVWVSVEDPLWKMEFTADNRCINYYEGSVPDSSTWSISNTSPQCGIEVLVEANTSYLQLTGIQDGEKMCYEINGVTDTHLSIRYLERGGAFVFTRQ